MYIPTIYVLFAAEFLLIMLGVSIISTIYAFKLARRPAETAVEDAEDEKNIDLGTSYIEYLEQELLRNESKANQQERIEQEDAESDQAEQSLELDTSEENSPPPNEEQSTLLKARQMFLSLERQAAEHTENEHNFWDSIYKGMQDLVEQFKTVVTEEKVVDHESVSHKKETNEKVFYIETQGKKIDGEVNKLKDIIFEQENTLNALRKNITSAGESGDEGNSELSEAMQTQLNDLERQLADSKMCMEVLEMENDRLQQELDQLEGQVEAVSSDDVPEKEESSSTVDLDQMKEVLDKQEQQIAELHATIEELEIDASKAEKLRETISQFTRSSQEMMGCISILEEENEQLKEQLHEIEEAGSPEGDMPPAAADANTEEVSQLKSKVSNLEEEIIKKDVAYAKLQDEYSSMEKEYLSMYEALHGDNG